MHARQGPGSALLRLATAQAGVLSREQALSLGLTRHVLARLVTDAGWTSVTAGIYCVTGRPDWTAHAWAGVLVGGDRARLGGFAAAWTAGLVNEPPTDIVIWVPADACVPTRQPAAPWRWVFRRDRNGVRGTEVVGHPPGLRLSDVVLDLVEESSQSEAIGLVTTAVQRRLTSPDQLRRALERRARAKHRVLIGELLRDVSDGAQSPLELRYLRDVERAHRLPTGIRQIRRRRTVIDVLYPDCGLIVELDGRLGHLEAGRFRDMARDNSAAGDGLTTLRYGWTDVTNRPCEVSAQVAHNLQIRGWTGVPSGCARCRRAPSHAIPDTAA